MSYVGQNVWLWYYFSTTFTTRLYWAPVYYIAAKLIIMHKYLNHAYIINACMIKIFDLPKYLKGLVLPSCSENDCNKILQQVLENIFHQ